MLEELYMNMFKRRKTKCPKHTKKRNGIIMPSNVCAEKVSAWCL